MCGFRPLFMVLATAFVFSAGCGQGSSRDDSGGDVSVGDDGSETGTDDSVARDVAPDTDSFEDPGPFEWPVETSPVVITPSNEWKNSVSFPDDPFLGGTGYTEYGNPASKWVKFSVIMRDPGNVYYQNSTTYQFHYEFGTARLDPFVGMNRQEFDAVTLHESGQELILGALVFAPAGRPAEVGVQLVRLDPYHPEMVRRVIETVKKSIQSAGQVKVMYFPTFEQYPSVVKYSEWFKNNGVEVSSADRWAAGNQCYSTGWALGRLVWVPGTRIDQAYLAGELKPTDIVITDGVPSEMPYLAGILSTTASTPNSHVAILAQSLGIPFVWISDASMAERLKAMSGRRVAMWTQQVWGSERCDVRVEDASELTDDDVLKLLELKNTSPLDFVSMQTKGAYFGDTEDLGPADVKYFGGKAANYGVIRDAIPENSRPAMALSFDVWAAFMAQPSGGSTLGAVIDNRLSAHRTWPPDMVSLDADLAAVREMITSAGFPAEIRAAVLSALSAFDPVKKIRFRSSTNMEDASEYTGAGLYDSFSGCLADDTDSDEKGPSACDDSEMNERGVFRAIKKVYASFFNRNAFLERLRRSVDPAKVGMAVLVHHSYADRDELANGVATFISRDYGDSATIVSQAGAVSVTNPDGGALPEVVTASTYGESVYLNRTQGSGLVPLGGYVMDWENDYVQLVGLMSDVYDRWVALTGRRDVTLDIEFKKMAGEGMILKQVREVPVQTSADLTATFLLGGTAEWCTFEGETGDIFGMQRLKVKAEVTARTGFVSDLEKDSWLGSIKLSYPFKGRVNVLEGTWESLVGASAVRQDRTVTTRFSDGSGADLKEWALSVDLPLEQEAAYGPFKSVSDLAAWASIAVTVQDGRPYLDWDGVVAERTDESINLNLCSSNLPVGPAHLLQERAFSDPKGNSYVLKFYWPPPPSGVSAGYTAPAVEWVSAEITGFTTEPINLTGYHARSYRPGHHNFSESFAFEPRLDPGVPESVIAELEAADIAVIYMVEGYPSLCIEHLDGGMDCFKPEAGK